MDECDDVRPGRRQSPRAGRFDGLVVNLRVAALQGLQYLIVKTAYSAHRKHSCQHPVFVSAGIRGPDRVLVPVLGSAHRSLQDSPSNFLGNAVVEIKLLEQLLDVTKRAPTNGYIVRILESIRLRLLEDWPKRNSRPWRAIALARQDCVWLPLRHRPTR